MKLVTITIFALLFLSACIQVEQPVEKIKIGVSQPFTGPAAFIGNWVRTGIEMAYSELPAENQSRIEFVFEDDGCTGKKGVDALQKLVSVDKVNFVIGPTCGNVIVPTIDLMRDSDTIYLTTGVIPELPTGAGDHHFTLQPRIRDLMYALAEYAYQNGARNLSVFYLDDEFGVESVKHFEKRFTEKSGKIVAKEKYGFADTDFRTQIAKLKDSPVDGVFIMSYGSWLINQLKQMDELGWKPQIYGPVPVQDPKLIEAAGKLAENIIYPYPEDREKAQKQIEFEAKYKERFGTVPEIYSTIGYDSFSALWQAIDKCGTNKVCVKKELAQLNFKGAGGIISLDADGIGKRNILIKQIKNGKFEFAEVEK